jgi:uncharacterized lipoprotein YmbA
MTNRSIPAALAALILVTLFSGCGLFPRSEPPQQFVLGTALPEVAPADLVGGTGATVGLRAVRLADHLVDPNIAVRRGDHRVTLSGQNRWSGQPERLIVRALATYMAARGPFSAVDAVPWPIGARYTYIVQVEMDRFEGAAPDGGANGAAGEAHVAATWTVSRGTDGEVIGRGAAEVRTPGWSVGDYPALVQMLDEALVRLAEEITASVAGL